MTLPDPDRFEGAAFHPSFPDSRTSGTITLQKNRLIFRWDGGEVAMPFANAQIDMGGASNRLVFFRNTSMPDWSIYTSDASILKHDYLDHPDLNQQVKKHRRKRGGIRLGYFAMAAIVIGLILSIISARHWMVSSLANQVPISWEKELGDQAMAQFRLSASIHESRVSQERLIDLTNALLDNMPGKRHDYQFYIVEDSSLNAMALPGGHIMIHTGLLQAAENEEQILGVLAHEIAHVEYRHGLRNIINSLGIVVLAQALLGDSTVFYGILVQAVPYLLRQEFSRDMEREADAMGLEILQQANVNPRGMVEIFEIMQRRMGNVGETTEQLSFLTSHPSLQERIETLNQKLSGANPSEYRQFDGVLAELIAGLNQTEPTTEEEEKEDEISH